MLGCFHREFTILLRKSFLLISAKSAVAGGQTAEKKPDFASYRHFGAYQHIRGLRAKQHGWCIPYNVWCAEFDPDCIQAYCIAHDA